MHHPALNAVNAYVPPIIVVAVVVGGFTVGKCWFFAPPLGSHGWYPGADPARSLRGAICSVGARNIVKRKRAEGVQKFLGPLFRRNSLVFQLNNALIKCFPH